MFSPEHKSHSLTQFFTAGPENGICSSVILGNLRRPLSNKLMIGMFPMISDSFELVMTSDIPVGEEQVYLKVLNIQLPNDPVKRRDWNRCEGNLEDIETRSKMHQMCLKKGWPISAILIGSYAESNEEVIVLSSIYGMTVDQSLGYIQELSAYYLRDFFGHKLPEANNP